MPSRDPDEPTIAGEGRAHSAAAKPVARPLIFFTALVLCVECGDDSTSEPAPSGGKGGAASGGTSGRGSAGVDGGNPGTSGAGSGEGGQGAAGGSGPSPEEILLGPCTEFCEVVAEAMCPNDDPASECVAGCLFAGSLAAECVPYFQDWLSCSIDTGVECTGDGLAEATSCYDEEELFSACIASLS